MEKQQVIPNDSAPNLPSKAQAKRYGLTRKQKAFADQLLANPKQPATKAIQDTYNASYNSARAMATENLAKPNILAYLNKHATEAELALIDAMKTATTADDRPDHAVRTKAADSILDRVHGKPTQRTEHVGVTTMVVMDLTGKGQAPPPEVVAELEKTD